MNIVRLVWFSCSLGFVDMASCGIVVGCVCYCWWGCWLGYFMRFDLLGWLCLVGFVAVFVCGWVVLM